MPKPRNRVRVRLTNQVLEKLLGLDESAEIVSVGYDASRELIDVIIRSDQALTPGLRVYQVAEGQEIPNDAPPAFAEAGSYVTSWDRRTTIPDYETT